MSLTDRTRNLLGIALADRNAADEINTVVDTIDELSAPEIGFIDGVTAGTAAADKAVVLDASRDIATIHDLTVDGNFSFEGATTENIITLVTNLADALSIVDSAGDLIVFDTSTGAQLITFTPSVLFSGIVTMSGGLALEPELITPNNTSDAASTISASTTAVDVAAVTNDADDWIVLPDLMSVQVGHKITIACNAGGAFEIRTPATSGEKINNVNSDGTAELAAVDTEIIEITKVSDTDGWIARSFTLAGATNGALTPD